MATTLPDHIGTAGEQGALLIEKVAADGTATVRDPASGQLSVVRLGILDVSGVLTIVAVGPGSG
jgi:hypothetical protein